MSNGEYGMNLGSEKQNIIIGHRFASLILDFTKFEILRLQVHRVSLLEL